MSNIVSITIKCAKCNNNLGSFSIDTKILEKVSQMSINVHCNKCEKNYQEICYN